MLVSKHAWKWIIVAILMSGLAHAAEPVSKAPSKSKASSAAKKTNAKKVKPKSEGESQAEKPVDMAARLALAKGNACLTCHGVDKKIIGPAFKEIASRYKGDSSARVGLIKKVKEGGGGVWGSVPMPPNPQVSDEDVKTLVSWVLAQ